MREKKIIEKLNNIVRNFLNSITDKNLKENMSKNLIISGGAIVSLIQNKKPNDYDIYFKNKEVVEKIRKYYGKLIGKKLSYEKLANSIAIRVNKPKDKKYYPIFVTNNAITLSNKIQLITKFVGTGDKIVENFDFEHLKNWFDYDKQELIIGKETYKLISQKRFVYTGSKYSLSAFFRVRKFLKRGWNIEAGEMLKIAWEINQLDLTNIDVLKEQLVGVDSLYFGRLVNRLKKFDEKVNYTKICKLIDEIWGS